MTLRASHFRAFLLLFGLATLFYLLGAAVIYFDLPTADFLRKGFAGGFAWYEGEKTPQPPSKDVPPLSVGKVDKPDKTCDGFTLCMYGGDSQAVLVNMRGETIHRWHVPFSKLWPTPTHVKGRVDDATVYCNDGHIYPNGDLVVVIEGPINADNSSNGYGLAKLDKDSNVIWKYAEKCHHDLDVAEDGTIYVLTNEVVSTVPKGLEFIPTPCMIDAIDVLSPEGKRLKRISILEAFAGSVYSPLLSVLERPAGPSAGMWAQNAAPFEDDPRRRDVLHTNAVKVLKRSQASKFPLFKPGQLLISPRHLDAIAVLDVDSGKIVWAASGSWRAQHDPSFLDNGHLLLFDNQGSPRSSRVLEYDPQTQAYPWSYPDDQGRPFLSKIRGMCQRLPNGNTLIVNSDGGEVFEVTSDRDVVWSLSCGRVELNRARRYLPEQLPFLKDQRPRRGK
ncbi:MAG TPA: arylsulfotransferase family protein [Gemmataceae bacterium]|nr:arylsulfotransferase family protein [Gemmataceae bacterium]